MGVLDLLALYGGDSGVATPHATDDSETQELLNIYGGDAGNAVDPLKGTSSLNDAKLLYGEVVRDANVDRVMDSTNPLGLEQIYRDRKICYVQRCESGDVNVVDPNYVDVMINALVTGESYMMNNKELVMMQNFEDYEDGLYSDVCVMALDTFIMNELNDIAQVGCA